MPICCRVSFDDADGIRHSVEVQADSLFEAAALPLAGFRRAELVVSAATLLDVALSEPPVTHTIQLARATGENNTHRFGQLAGDLS